MKRIVVETSVLIDFFRGKGDRLTGFFNLAEINVTATTAAELLVGVMRSQEGRKVKQIRGFLRDVNILDFDAISAKIFAETKVDLMRRGKVIPDMDIQIAAVCLQHHLPLLTKDAHFRNIKGLDLL